MSKRKPKPPPALDPGAVLHRCPGCGHAATMDDWPGAGAECCICDREPCDCIPSGGCGTWCGRCGWAGYLTDATRVEVRKEGELFA